MKIKVQSGDRVLEVDSDFIPTHLACVASNILMSIVGDRGTDQRMQAIEEWGRIFGPIKLSPPPPPVALPALEFGEIPTNTRKG